MSNMQYAVKCTTQLTAKDKPQITFEGKVGLKVSSTAVRKLNR